MNVDEMIENAEGPLSQKEGLAVQVRAAQQLANKLQPREKISEFITQDPLMTAVNLDRVLMNFLLLNANGELMDDYPFAQYYLDETIDGDVVQDAFGLFVVPAAPPQIIVRRMDKHHPATCDSNASILDVIRKVTGKGLPVIIRDCGHEEQIVCGGTHSCLYWQGRIIDTYHEWRNGSNDADHFRYIVSAAR